MCVAAGDRTDTTAAATAKQAVELGLQRFEAGDAQAALDLFLRAQQLRPNDDELRAALYNAACAFTKLKRWSEATDAVMKAVNQYDLKLAVALRDPDLAPLRERREWTAALEKMAGGVTNDSYVKLRAEAKAPFRLTRIILFGGLAAGAGLGLLIITTRLIAAFKGGEGAPELQETLQNFAINSGVLAVLGFFLLRDLAANEKDKEVVQREEALAALQLSLGPGRVLPIAAFRGTARLVILAGSKGQVARAVAAAEPFKGELRTRGVSLVPVVLNMEDLDEKLRRLKAELATDGDAEGSGAAAAAASSAPQGFATGAKAGGTGSESTDGRWQLAPHALPEWESWVAQQKKVAGVGPNDSVYVQVQLDGSVRASGVGIPPWRQFLDDLPEMDSVRTKLTDGRGMA